jgi:hypothetical protein
MGVGLVSKYRYTLEDKLYTLRDDFKTQIEKYLPQYQAVEVSVKLEDHVCYITAKLDNTIYAFFYNENDNTVSSKYKSLNDL